MADSRQERMNQSWRLWQGEARLPPPGLLPPPTLGALPIQSILSRGPRLDLTCCLKSPTQAAVPLDTPMGPEAAEG